jgi:glycine/D-amino acid oxidase-like deaminating enzyme
MAGVPTSDPRIVICGAGVIGASVAFFLARRGASALVVDRARPAAAASGRAAGLLARDWTAGTPSDPLSREGFALHRALAGELGAERLGYRPVTALLTAAAEDEDLEPHRGLPNPDWLDGDVVAHSVIGDLATTAQVDPHAYTLALLERAREGGAAYRPGVVEGLRCDGPGGRVSAVVVDGVAQPADVVVLALGPWTPQAQRWVPLPQVFQTRMASLVLAAELPAQGVWSEYIAPDRRRVEFRMYPRPDGTVYVSGLREHTGLPDDPDDIAPADATCRELRRIAGVHAGVLRDAAEVRRAACHRPLAVDGLPLIGPVPGAPGVVLATAHGSWGILHAPVTGRMVAEMILDGAARTVDPTPFAPARLPAGRIR